MIRLVVVRFATFQQHGSRGLLYEGVDFRGKGMPAIHAGSSGSRPLFYFTVTEMVVELVMAVTPLLDWPVTVTV